MQLEALCDHLEQIAPLRLAESWDNVGLLVGDRSRRVERVMTCLTVTPESAREAIVQNADLIIAHHPMPFRELKRITTDSTVGRLLWNLIEAGVSIYSAHTAWDSACGGINQQLAEGLQLDNIVPLIELDEGHSAERKDSTEGPGRVGSWSHAKPLNDVIQSIKNLLSVQHLDFVGDLERMVRRVGIACGSAGSFLSDVDRAGCDLMLLGETTFHTALEAEALGVALAMPGHFASERFAMETLAARLAKDYPDLHVWACACEHDPIRRI